MNRLLLSAAFLLGLLGSAFGQSISTTPGNVNSVIGPGAAVTDHAIVRWDGVTGTLVEDSLAILSETGTLTAGTGAAATPTYSFTAGTDTGFYFTASGPAQDGIGVTRSSTNTALFSSNGLSFKSTLGIVWTGNIPSDAADLFLGRAAAASLLLGAADAAAPVAQTLGVQSVVAGTANTAGANFTIAGSKSTGSAAGGSIIFQTAAAGGAGSGQNALATALTINSAKAATFAGVLSVPNGAVNGAAISSGSVTSGIYWTNASNISIALNGVETWRFNGGGDFESIGGFGIAATIGAPDVILVRDAANTLALRNSTTAQVFRVYNTYTDASNYERAMFDWITSANTLRIGTQIAGTGSHAQVEFWSGSQRGFYMDGAVSGTVHFSNGIDFPTDNTYDIGASGATRPRTVYVGTNIWAGNNVDAINFTFSGQTRGFINAASDGVFGLNNAAGSGFTRLQFGGTTTAFPAIGRNGVNAEILLADGSTYSSLAARALFVRGVVPTLALAGGTCAGTVIAGGSTAGTVTLTGVCVATNTMALTVMPTAPTGYACDAIDRTLGSSLLTETATTTTSVTFTFGGTTGATDVLAYKCIAY